MCLRLTTKVALRGVDKAQWELGATGQGDFLAKAQAEGMMWSHRL
jgi:hypothetical protein